MASQRWTGPGCASVQWPGSCASGEFIRDAGAELAQHDAGFNLSHVEPTAMLGGVMESQFASDAAGQAVCAGYDVDFVVVCWMKVYSWSNSTVSTCSGTGAGGRR